MFTTPKNKYRFSLITLGVVFLALALNFTFAREGRTVAEPALLSFLDCKDKEWAQSNYFGKDASGCPDLVEYVLSPSFINEEYSELVLRVLTMPSGYYGVAYSSAGYATAGFNVDVDGINLSRQVNLQGEIAQGITTRSKMTTKNNLFYYPLDRYTGEINMQAVDGISKASIPGVVSVLPSAIHGWNLKFSESPENGEVIANKTVYPQGVIKTNWSLGRSGIVFLSVAIMVLLMIIALISVFFLTKSVSSGNRPPSMNLLLWISTVLFAILQVRISFPGNPPIGILLDYIIVFPVLSILLLLGILNTISWLRRPDWDLENEPTSA